MSIRVYAGYHLRMRRQIFQIIVFGKDDRMVQIGSSTTGKNVAVRCFRIGVRMLIRGK